jgi:hypothetical protein
MVFIANLPGFFDLFSEKAIFQEDYAHAFEPQ